MRDEWKALLVVAGVAAGGWGVNHLVQSYPEYKAAYDERQAIVRRGEQSRKIKRLKGSAEISLESAKRAFEDRKGWGGGAPGREYWRKVLKEYSDKMHEAADLHEERGEVELAEAAQARILQSRSSFLQDGECRR